MIVINYIEDKYGFTPTLTSVELDYPTINIGYTKMSDVSKFIGYGLGKEGAEIISKEYIISGDHEKTKIYFPAFEYSSYNTDKINIGLECGDNHITY